MSRSHGVSPALRCVRPAALPHVRAGKSAAGGPNRRLLAVAGKPRSGWLRLAHAPARIEVKPSAGVHRSVTPSSFPGPWEGLAAAMLTVPGKSIGAAVIAGGAGMRVVAALGGNALLERGEPPEPDRQQARAVTAEQALAPGPSRPDRLVPRSRSYVVSWRPQGRWPRSGRSPTPALC